MARPKMSAGEKAEARDRFEAWLATMDDFLRTTLEKRIARARGS